VRSPSARGIHQNAPHHLRREREELRAVPPAGVLDIYQTKVSFVDQSGGLKRVPVPLIPHIAASHAQQVVVNNRCQAVKRGLVAIPPGPQ
jgi:hypothetical protein